MLEVGRGGIVSTVKERNTSLSGLQELEEQWLVVVTAVFGEIGRGFACLLFIYAIATVFHLYHRGVMLYEMRRRNPKPTLYPTQGIFNLPNHIGMV